MKEKKRKKKSEETEKPEGKKIKEQNLIKEDKSGYDTQKETDAVKESLPYKLELSGINRKELKDFSAEEFIPVIPLKDIVIFPYTVYPVLAGRESTIKAIDFAVEKDMYVFLATQVNSLTENIDPDNLYKSGTVAKIIQVLRMPNGLIKILVDGLSSADVIKYTPNSFIKANVKVKNFSGSAIDPELEAVSRKVKTLFTDYINANPVFPKETLITFQNIPEFDRRAFYVSSTINIDIQKKQYLLEISDLKSLYYELAYYLTSELEISNIIKEIDNKVYTEMQKNQRRFIVQEQIRILQDELGEGSEILDPDLQKMFEKIENCGMPESVKAKAMEEFNKLKKTSSMSPDFSVTRNYLDWMVSVPWNIYTEDNYNLDNAQSILDEDHYNLEKPKERIIELLAILKLLHKKNIKKPPKGQILCLVGPPGVGKTSLGKSIARALNRKFARLSVGGVKDEAEIRGHRRTYIGSMPGKIIQAMKRAGTCNPVILIDEIDKMGSDWRGDPASAMLEVLDPEQNNTFNDHYLDVDYDLSSALFITTANISYNIPPALLDRMEIIEMRSYLDFEKIQIAKRHIIPKELSEHGLKKNAIVFPDGIILKIIREYTRESGVRNLERELTNIIRKLIKSRIARENIDESVIKITEKDVEKYLGVRKFPDTRSIKEKERIGSATGLAWTSHGGDILAIDVTIMKGADKLTLTGKLGEVMKESAQAGLSYIKSNAKKFGIPENYFKDKEIHIHVPEGAIPKDGPSAGITMITAMLSSVTKNPVKTDVALTGEITLRGNVLPIGGLNEKLLAALRSGIKTVLVPEENKKDLAEVPKDIKGKLKIITMKTVEDMIPYLFGSRIIKFKKTKS
ncbi:MAG: endopeptidase La [Ignavibacteria bacterium]|nr:endopeptidase La [Ignavibacteria bacterium]